MPKAEVMEIRKPARAPGPRKVNEAARDADEPRLEIAEGALSEELIEALVEEVIVPGLL